MRILPPSAVSDAGRMEGQGAGREPLGFVLRTGGCVGFFTRRKNSRLKKTDQHRKVNVQAESTKKKKIMKGNVTLFKGIPIQSMLEIPLLPIKSVSSTSAAAADNTV